VKRFVLDASALIVFFEDLPGAEKVEEIIKRALDGKVQLSMCVLNWGEACYSMSRAKGSAAARKTLAGVAQLPIALFEANSELTSLAVGIRIEYALPYASCFAAALARQRRASLMTADRLFSPMEKQMSIAWVDGH
jgi:predicted nucleic acid-binding protein